MKEKYLFIGGALYLVGITIIGICDTLNNGVKKREEAQDIRSERLERNQIRLQKQVERMHQKMADDMKRR